MIPRSIGGKLKMNMGKSNLILVKKDKGIFLNKLLNTAFLCLKQITSILIVFFVSDKELNRKNSLIGFLSDTIR